MTALARVAPPRGLAGFERKVRMVTRCGCWEWIGARTYGKNGKPYGYVQWMIGGRQRFLHAHRVAYALAKGADVDSLRGLDVHHTCGNTLCVNPSHLEATPTDEHGRRHRFGQLQRDVDGYAAFAAAEEVTGHV